MKHRKARFVIQAGGFDGPYWMTRDGTWTEEWKRARRFETQDRAEDEARLRGITNYGIFPTSAHR